MSAIIINPNDNVAIVLRDVAGGEKLELSGGVTVTAAQDIPYTHKIALVDIEEGNPVIKYGETVAVACCRIKCGEWVHTHNVNSGRE